MIDNTPPIAPTENAKPSGERTRADKLWGGRALSGISVLFLTLDGVGKLAHLQVVVDTTAKLGWPTDGVTLSILGVVLLSATLLYAIPRTAALGAIVLTGYLGGAVATHARIGSPLFSHVLFGVYIGVMVWSGLWLRNAHLRALIR